MRWSWSCLMDVLLALLLASLAMVGLFMVDGLLTLALGALLDAARTFFGG